MSISQVSKYIIVFLFAVLVVLSVLLTIYHAENKALNKANTVLKEQVALRDTAINEIDKNIQALQQQVIEAERICNERIKARSDVLLLLNKDSPRIIQPAASLKKEQAKNGASPAPFNNLGEMIDYEKSIFVIDNINNYWVQFTHADSSKK